MGGREGERAAGAEKMTLILICVDDKEAAHDIVRLCGNKFSEATVLVRTFDRTDAIELNHAGVDDPVRETLDPGLRMGCLALDALNVPEEEAGAVVEDVRRRDERRLTLQVEETAESDIGRLEAMKKIKPEPVGPAR